MYARPNKTKEQVAFQRMESTVNNFMSLTLHPELPLITFVHNWLVAVKKTEVKESTYDRLLISIEALTNYDIANMKVSEITVTDFSLYVQQLIAVGYSISTIKKQMRIVSAPIHYAYINGLLKFDPCMAVKVPAQSNVIKQSREVVAYTPEEQERLIEVINGKTSIPYLIANFIMETGIRIGEAMALKWNDVMIERRRMRIHSTMVNLRNGKGSFVQEGAKSKTSNRTIPLSKKAVEILRQLKSFSESEFVFADENGKEPTYEAMRYNIQKLCNEANVTYYGLHVFRHTFATNQYYKGTDVKILSKLLGHADASITYNVYIHLYGDGFDDMLKAVD